MKEMFAPEMTTQVDMVGKLRDALMKDFNALYVKEYSTTWEVERIVRNTEINFMPLTHTLELLNRVKNQN